MNRRFSDFGVYLSMLLVLVLHFVTGWLAAPDAGKLLTSGLPAMLVLLLCCLPLYVIHQRMLSGAPMVTILFFVFLATAHPAAFHLSPLHGATALMTCCLFCYLSFTALHPTLDNAAGLWLSFGGAVLLLPSLLWLAPVLLLSSIGKADEKGKYTFTALLCLVLPAVIWLVVRYLLGNPLPPGNFLAGVWEGMCTLHLPSTNLPLVTLVRIGFTAVMVVTAFGRILPRLSRFKTAQYHAVVRLMLMTICLGAYVDLFLGEPGQPREMLFMLPTAPLLSVFLLDTLPRRKTPPWYIILLLLLAAERISYFVNL